MKQWIKLSAGVHKDRKLWKLSKDAQLAFFYLLSLAGSEDNDGVLPSFEDISLELWFLRLSEKTLRSVIIELMKAGIIEETDSDELKLKNFEKWQTSEKTKSEIDHEYYIKNKKQKTESQRNLSGNSVKSQSELSEQSAEIPTLEKEIEIDKEIDKDLTVNANALTDARAEKSEPKRAFGSLKNVMLTDEEYRSLQDRFSDADDKIEAMSLYFGSHGNAKKYKNHYATALNWARMAAERDSKAPKQPSASKQQESWIEVAERLSREGWTAGGKS